MYNFMDPKLLPKVTTTAAALDDYEAVNLVSDDFRTRARGFLAFTSIKPPVDIHFEFMCNIQIRYIKLQTTLGSHKTIGIEVLTGQPSASLGLQIYDENKLGLIMCDSKYYSKQKPPDTTDMYHLAYFKSYQHRLFTQTNKLCIRIIRTDCRSVPCLGTVEVWGFVAKNCSRETKQTIHKLMTKSATQALDIGLTSAFEGLLDEFAIPDDFKDALTYEVMALPMTLPSGNTIDQSTLEKCIANDIRYGRKAADPFTGLEFSHNHKPVPNVALKSRIDVFLLKYSNLEQTRNISRTVGTSLCSTSKRNHDKLDSKTFDILPPKKQKLECEPATGDNLDDAIAKVVSSGSFMCFTKTDPPRDPNFSKKMCSKCKCEVNLYEITICSHLFCRTCLFRSLNVCATCKTTFVNGAVVKVNQT